MGLALSVGYLADILQNDPDEAYRIRADFGRVNEFLESLGLPAHAEPETCEGFSCDMWGYSGLHYLRRFAAHLDLRGTPPEPGDQGSSHDPVLASSYERADPERQTIFSRTIGLLRRRRSFDHLIVHSDAEGYYLPLDFPHALVAPPEFKIPGAMIGSSIRLREECRKLAIALKLPLDLDPESEEIGNAAENHGVGESWQRYGIESFTCVRLHAAAEHSIKSRAAIVFC